MSLVAQGDGSEAAAQGKLDFDHSGPVAVTVDDDIGGGLIHRQDQVVDHLGGDTGGLRLRFHKAADRDEMRAVGALQAQQGGQWLGHGHSTVEGCEYHLLLSYQE